MIVARALPRLATCIAALLAPGLASAALPPAGTFYKLTVNTSFEPSFADCWAFLSNGAQIYSPRLKYFAYQLAGLNTNAGHFQALWQGRNSIGFSGVASGGMLSGDAVDSRSRTYSYAGVQVSSCAGQPAASPGSPGFITR